MSTLPCPYFSKCGGCTIQHLDYTLQLENKKKLVQRIINNENILVFSDKEYFYRNRMDFVFFPGGLGLRARGNASKVIDIERCMISDERLNQLLTDVRTFFQRVDAFVPKTKKGTFRYAVIRVTRAGDSSVSIVLNEDSRHLHQGFKKVKQFASQTKAHNVIITLVPSTKEVSVSDEFEIVKGKESLTEVLCGKRFVFPIQGFFQNNTVMAEKMQEYVHGIFLKYNTTRNLKNALLLDLYSGVGTFGILNAEFFQKVVMIESVPSAIQMARKNIPENNISNAEALVLDAKQLHTVSFDSVSFDSSSSLFVITDPPRSGMEEKTIRQLKLLKPEVIVYVSCNVEQLGRDLGKFSGYSVKSAALFDLFPQTNHSEVVVELILKK